MSELSSPSHRPSTSGAGPLVALLVVAVLAGGGVLYWKSAVAREAPEARAAALAVAEPAADQDSGAGAKPDGSQSEDGRKPAPASEGKDREGSEGKAEKEIALAGKKKKDEDVEYPFRRRLPVPDNIFEGGRDWLNTSGDVRLKDLRGKVVILDFWTYCCINCMHVLPDLAYIEKKYPNEVVVIGVHTAKFDNEKETENIRRAVQRYNIEHPVVNDGDQIIWRKFGVNSWPTLLVIDAEGNACFATSGEGKKELLDEVVKSLVEYHAANKTLDRTPVRFDLERQKLPPQPLKFPGKVLADEPGNRLFIADTNHNRLVIASLDGKLLDVVGTGGIGAADGPYDKAMFDHPQGMALVGDSLYVADTENHLLRVVDLKQKTVTTLAGTGEQDRERTPGGKLRKTPLNSPWDLLVLDGTLFIAMAGPHQLWSHKLGSEEIRIYAGSGREDILNGPLDEAAFAQPSGLATDGKNLYVADSEGSSIRRLPADGTGRVVTLAGTSNLPRGQSLFAFGDVDGDGDEARFQHPIGVAWHEGAVFVADSYNHKVRKVALKGDSGTVSTWLGDGKPGSSVEPLRLNEPHGLSAAKGKMYVADTNNHRIVVADLATGGASVLKIEGLAPPKKTEPAPVDAPSKGVTEVAAQTVAAGEELKLDVAIELPDGYKLNPLGTVTARLKAAGEQPLIAVGQLDVRHKADTKNGRITLSIPATGKEGEGTFEISVSLTYCREGTGGVCKLGTVRWKVPVKAAAGAKQKSIPLDGRIE